MKKLLSLLCLLLLLLTACGGKEDRIDTSGELHPHTFASSGFDATHHFLLCDCGERDSAAPHDFTEDSFCRTCGFYIYDMGSGSYSIYVPDEFGSIVLQQDFDAYDKQIYNWHAEYEYYDDHNPKHVKEYLDGVLQSEHAYLHCADPANGEVYLSEETYYNEDGTWETLRYDETCNILSVTLFDSLGQRVTHTVYTYEFDAAGNCTRELVHTDDLLSLEIRYTADADGNFYPHHYIYYTEAGEIDSEFRFDAHGNEIE